MDSKADPNRSRPPSDHSTTTSTDHILTFTGTPLPRTDTNLQNGRPNARHSNPKRSEARWVVSANHLCDLGTLLVNPAAIATAIDFRFPRSKN